MKLTFTPVRCEREGERQGEEWRIRSFALISSNLYEALFPIKRKWRLSSVERGALGVSGVCGGTGSYKRLGALRGREDAERGNQEAK